MEAFTDIQQSRKLAEILPMESVDMYYPNRTDTKYQGALPIEWKRGLPLLSQEIPCWSLTALLDLLPNNERLQEAFRLQQEVDNDILQEKMSLSQQELNEMFSDEKDIHTNRQDDNL